MEIAGLIAVLVVAVFLAAWAVSAWRNERVGDLSRPMLDALVAAGTTGLTWPELRIALGIPAEGWLAREAEAMLGRMCVAAVVSVEDGDTARYRLSGGHTIGVVVDNGGLEVVWPPQDRASLPPSSGSPGD